jgi:macrolide-specific efflux system membrane fusion protein
MRLSDLETRLWRLTPAFIRSQPPLHRRGGLAALILLIALLFSFGSMFGNGGVKYRTATVETGNIEQTVTALGSLQPKDYVDVGAQVSGELQLLHVDFGDKVKKGDLLAEVDPTVYESTVAADNARLADLRSQVSGQQAQLALAQRQHQRNLGLLKIDAVSRDAVDTSETSVKSLRASIASTQAQIEQAESTLKGDMANLSYTKIYAPMDGTVVSITTLQGQMLNSRQSAPTILRIADLATMTVKAQVAEADISKLKVGMPVYFTTLGTPDRRWQSTVRQILPTPETVNDVILYNALTDVANPDNKLMTSMTAQVFFVLGEAKDALLVPVAALRPARQGAEGAYTVQVMRGSRAERREVKIGLQTRTSAEVLSGLKQGDIVVTGVETSASGSDADSRTGGSGGRGGQRGFGSGRPPML